MASGRERSCRFAGVSSEPSADGRTLT